jgi:hypothetical protein
VTSGAIWARSDGCRSPLARLAGRLGREDRRGPGQASASFTAAAPSVGGLLTCRGWLLAAVGVRLSTDHSMTYRDVIITMCNKDGLAAMHALLSRGNLGFP